MALSEFQGEAESSLPKMGETIVPTDSRATNNGEASSIPPQDAQNLERLRAVLADLRKKAPQVGEISPNDPANINLDEYLNSRVLYLEKRDRLFTGLPYVPLDHKSNIEALRVVFANVFRVTGQFFRGGENKIEEERELIGKKISIDVVKRSDLLKDDRLMSIITHGENSKKGRDLFDKEIFKEVNASHFLIIRGLDLEDFRKVVSLFGENPNVFFSDFRGEDLRFAIDNKSPFVTNPTIEEQYYWQKVFPGLLGKLPGIRNWRMSRTHGQAWEMIDGQENILIVTVHVDPKNWTSIFRPSEFALYIKNKLLKPQDVPSSRDAQDYHQTVAGKGANYVGTGLYRMGVVATLNLFKGMAAKGLLGDVKISGDKGIETSLQISDDNKITWLIKSIVVENPRLM